MKFTLILAGCTVLSLLTACTTTSTITALQRDAYLQQFIGRSSQYIQAHLDLSRLGYRQVHAPVRNSQTLTYTVIRPVRIPVPIAPHPAGTGPGAVPIQVTPPAQSYDVKLQCRITFLLKAQIATAVSSTGPTC
jgi:hypothetical protein